MTIAQTQLTNAQVSLFYDPTYMEVNTFHSSEPYNIKQILEANGHTVTTFVGADTDAWRNATQGADVLVIPSLEVAAVSLSPGAMFFLKDFVSRGGTLVTTQSFDQPNTDLLDALFDTSLNEGLGGPSTATAAVGGTTYSGAAAAIPNNLGPVEALQAASLPVFATSLYENASGNSTVAAFQYGKGQIIWLGWDFYNALPAPGTLDGGWNDVLNRSVSFTDFEPNGLVIDGTNGNDRVDVDPAARAFEFKRPRRRDEAQEGQRQGLRRRWP